MSDSDIQRGILSYGVRRPVGMLMLVLAAVVFGVVSLGKLPVDLLPAMDYPSLTVRTAYPGAAPSDVEERVTERLEDVLSTVGSVVSMRSSSRAELSEIQLEFEWGSNLPFLVQDVRERLDRVFLPQGAEKPLILRYDPGLDPILRIAISGDTNLTRLRDLAERKVERELESIAGVAAVRVRGGLEEEIVVMLDTHRMANLKLTPELVKARLAEENLNVPGGTLEEGSVEYVVRTLNEFRTIDEISELPLVTRGGVAIKLHEVAKVQRFHKDRDVILRVAGAEAVEIDIFREAGANLVEVSELVRERLFGEEATTVSGGGKKKRRGETNGPSFRTRKSVKDSLPSGITLTLLSDQSRFVKEAIDEVKSAAILGGLMAILVCYFFLRRFSATMLIGLAVPVSVIATFGAMYSSGITMNIMSLGGLALGIGMLVDNTIVVLESIARRREMGDSPKVAAVRGVQEVGSAVTASTLTTVAVFAPIIFVEGVAGQTFGDQALTVVASLSLSLAVALFFLPGLAARVDLSPQSQPTPKRKQLADLSQGLLPRLRAFLNRSAAGPGKQSRAALFLELLLVPIQALRKKSVWLALALSGGAGWCFAHRAALLAASLAENAGKMPGGGGRSGMGAMVSAATEQAAAGWLIAGILLALPLMWVLGEPILRFLGAVLADLLSLVLVLLSGLGGLALIVFQMLAWLPSKAVSGIQTGLERAYPHLLRRALQAPAAVLLIAAIFAAMAWNSAGSLGRELLPEVKQGELTAELFFPAGYPLSETDRISRELTLLTAQIQGVAETAVLSGADAESISSEETGPHRASLTVRTEQDGDARATEMRVETELRHILEREPALARYYIRRPTLLALNAPLEIEVFADDLSLLGEATAKAANALREVPGITDLRSSLRRGNPEVRITLDREKLARHNLTVGSVASHLRLAVEGEAASTFPGLDERIDIRVRADLSQLKHVEQLRELPVNPEADKPLPLGAIATFTIADGPSEIRHVDNRRAAVLSASIAGFDLGATSEAVIAALEEMPKLPGVRFDVSGQKKEMDEALGSLNFALLLAIFLVYAVMAAQFESLLQPLLILFSVPLAGIGAVFGLSLTGTPLSIVALLGAVILAGIVVNNAIVLVDRINRNRDEGMELNEAIIQGGKTRLRPILMTTTTTVLGMLPLTGWLAIAGAAEGTELRAPMALVVICGLVASTLLTLVVIPAGYRLLAQFTSKTHNA